MDVARIRKDFPLFDKDHDVPVYLDSACQTLRPRQVIEAMDQYYEAYPACGGRSVHRLATQVHVSGRLDKDQRFVFDFQFSHIRIAARLK